MARSWTLGLVAWVAFGASACTAWAPPVLGALSSGVELRGRMALQQQATAAPAVPSFRLATYLTPPTGDDIAWVEVYLAREDQPASEAFVGRLPGLQSPVVIQKLRPNATYRVRLEAYDGSDERLDDNRVLDDQDPLAAKACELVVSTTNNLFMSGFSFPLRLISVPFDGTARGNLSAQNGEAVVAQPEAIATRAVVGFQDPATPHTAVLDLEGNYYRVEVDQEGFTDALFPPNVPGYECYGGDDMNLSGPFGNVTVPVGGVPTSLPLVYADGFVQCFYR